MDQYRVMELREVFIELFCTVKTAVDNPMMNPSGSGGRRAFLVLHEVELEGNFGYWAEDEEHGRSFRSIRPDSCFCFAFSGFEGAVWAACLQTNWPPLGLESCVGFCCFGCVPNGASRGHQVQSKAEASCPSSPAHALALLLAVSKVPFGQHVCRQIGHPLGLNHAGVLLFRMRAKWCPTNRQCHSSGGVRGLEGMSLASLMRISGHSCVFLNHLPTTCHVIVTARCHAPSMRFVDIFGDEGMGPMWPHCIERLAL